MSNQALTWAFEQDIPSRAKIVLIALANHADHTTGHCWPSIATLMRESSCSRGAVFNYLGALKRNGYVMVQQSKAITGRSRSNNYWIVLDRPPAEWISLKREDAEENDILPEPDEAQELEGDEIESPQRGLRQNDDSHPENEVESPQRGRGIVHNVDPLGNEPSESEPTTTLQVEGPGLQPPAAPAPPPQALAQAERPKAAFERRKPQGFDPNARQREVQAIRTAEDNRRKSQRVFVIEGTRAWEAWCATKPQGFPTTVSDGKRGWWFPSLFPPPAKGPGDRTTPQQSPASPENETEYYPELSREMGG